MVARERKGIEARLGTMRGPWQRAGPPPALPGANETNGVGIIDPDGLTLEDGKPNDGDELPLKFPQIVQTSRVTMRRVKLSSGGCTAACVMTCDTLLV